MNSNRAANPMSGPSPWVNSRRADRQAPRVRELDLNSLPYVPLPRAPLRWGTPSARAHSQMQEAEALFEIRDAPWQLPARKLPHHLDAIVPPSLFRTQKATGRLVTPPTRAGPTIVSATTGDSKNVADFALIPRVRRASQSLPPYIAARASPDL
jgi:hypothetical protein